MNMIRKQLHFAAALCLSMGLALAGNPELPVNLNSAGDFVILAKAGISTVPPSAITGDMGVSPITSTAITGFSLIMDISGEFSTSAQVDGKIYAPNYLGGTPMKMTTAISDMETAYTNAAGRTIPDTINDGAVAGSDRDIGGLTITPGLHKWSTGVLISTNVTLDALGDPGAVFIFQIEGDLTVASGQRVLLAGGAQAGNIFWQVAGGTGAIIGTTAHFEGVVLTATAINVLTGASFNGKLLAQTDVNLQQTTLVNMDPLPDFTLTYTAGLGGSILGDSPQIVLQGGNGTEVTAVPGLGYYFVQWSDASVSNPRTDMNVQQDITVEAEFAEIITPYTLTYTAGLGGSIFGISPQIVNEGANGTAVTPTPAPGYTFVQWSDLSTDSPRTDMNVQQDITVEASFVADAPACGILVTLGAIVENDLSGVFTPTGEDPTYSTLSDDLSVMTSEITPENRLRTEAVGLGNVTITVRATYPTQPEQLVEFGILVVGHPTTVSEALPPHELWNPRFTQEFTIRNDDLCDAIGIRLLFSNLQEGIVVENQTGFAPAPDGRAAIEMAFDFAPGESVDLSVIYLATGAFRPDQHPPTVEIQFILADIPPHAEGELGPNIERIEVMADGRVFLEFTSKAGSVYLIQYMDNYPNGNWETVALELLAGSNRTQWIDHGSPATPPAAGVRAYSVVERTSPTTFSAFSTAIVPEPLPFQTGPEENREAFGTVTPMGPNAYSSDDFGMLAFDETDPNRAYSESLQSEIIAIGDKIYSPLYGWLAPNHWGIPQWVVSEYFGLVHFGQDAEQYDGWVSSERFGWMRFVEDEGGTPYLWVHRLQTWMFVYEGGSFYSFDFGWFIPEGDSFTRYQSRIGTLIHDENNPDGWLRSEQFGFVWFARDASAVWFWSANRNEWLGITSDGGIWSTSEEAFLPPPASMGE